AFVLIQHLAPDHESYLAELLQQHTEMPVMLVQQEVPVRPNHVYVIPPAKALTLCEGRLRVADASTENGSHLCMAEGRRGVIDHFFCSLAQDQGENAICVILSG